MADINSILKQRGLMSLKEYDSLMQNQSFISTGYKEIDDIIERVRRGEKVSF